MARNRTAAQSLSGPLFGRVPDARQTVRDVNEELIQAIKKLRAEHRPPPPPPNEARRPEFPMRLLQSIVHAHILTDCVVGNAVPVIAAANAAPDLED